MSAVKFLPLLSIFLAAFAFGQSDPTDSLEQKLKTSKGKDRVDILNALTYESITRDNEKVLNYGNQAIELSKKTGYVKGEARAYTLRGVYEYLTGQFPKAHLDLHRGLNLSRIAHDKSGEGYALLQLGNCGLEEAQNDSAFFYLKESYKILRDSADPANLSKVYRNLSSLYGQLNKVDSQRFYIDRAIEIRRLLPSKMLLADAIVLKANIQLRSGDYTGTESLLAECEEIIKLHPEDVENLNDIRHLRALILFQQGKFEEATVLFDSARSYYFRTSFMRKYVVLLSDLGRVFSDRGEYELALNNLYDGLRISKLKGFGAETAMLRNQIGWVNFHLGDLNQALRLANEVLSTANFRMPVDRANAMMLRGVTLTGLRDFRKAKVCLDSVYQIYGQMGDRRGLSETLLNLGYLESLQGHTQKALAHYHESIGLAETESYYFGLAWSCWGIGECYFKSGDYRKAAQFLDRSEKFAHLTGTTEVLVLNFNTRRDLLEAQARYKESLQYARMASQLNDSIHNTDLARRFVNLEKMQEIEQRDRDIKMLQKDNQLAEDKINLQESRLRQQSILILASLAGIMLLGALAFVYYRFFQRIKTLNVSITEKNTRIQAQADALHNVNQELSRLYQAVSEQKEKIQAQANELTESHKNVSDINRSLEKLVSEKTIELRSTNEELVKHNSELLQFSYTVSHNLRGPVARLLGLSQMIHAEEDISKARQWIALIQKTASDLDLIIKDLSKILDLRNEPHQYREIVELEQEWQQSCRLLQDSLIGKEEIITNFTALPEIYSVRAMLQSIFYNLLSNAIKFKSPDRNLKIIAISRVQNGKAILEITDNGLGFNTQLHREKLFKLYNRFHTHVEGRGLGLYLIKSQIEVLHGTIEVESQLDRGSMFRIILPISEEETPEISHAAVQES